MPQPVAPTPKPLSLRLNHEQRQKLLQEADGYPLSTYIKLRLFGSTKSKTNGRVHRPVKDKQELGRLLAKLGQSGLAANILDLANAAESGSLIMDPDTNAALLEATRDIQEIRQLLIKALGLRD